MAHVPLALQMYTVRDQTAEDFAGTYRAVAAMGYEGVEVAGDGGLSADELKQLLDDCGLIRCGMHVGIEQLERDLDAVADYQLAISNPWVVIPWLPVELRADAAAWRRMGGRLSELGGRLNEHGLTLCYHNHAFEFEVEEHGRYGLDLLYDAADPALLQAEIDTYWVQYGGQDPAAYITRYRERTPLIHLKDMTATEPRTFTEVGTGILDFQSIFAAAEGGPVAAWIVEQDTCQRPSLESAELSLRNLRGLMGR